MKRKQSLELGRDGCATFQYMAGGKNKTIHLDKKQIRYFLAQGLLEKKKGHLYPTAEAQNWIRRQLSQQQSSSDCSPPTDKSKTLKPHHLSDTKKASKRRDEVSHESPLAWLSKHKDKIGNQFLDIKEIDAGERLRLDIEISRSQAHITTNWQHFLTSQSGKRSGGSSAYEMSDQAIAAMTRVRKAMDSLGKDMGHLLFDLCGNLKSITQIEKERQWPQRSAKVVIKIALSRLAEHYLKG